MYRKVRVQFYGYSGICGRTMTRTCDTEEVSVGQGPVLVI